MEATAAAALWGGLNSGVVLSLIAVLWTVAWQSLQHLQLHHLFKRHLRRHARRLAAIVDPYHSVTIEVADVEEDSCAQRADPCLGGARSQPSHHRLAAVLRIRRRPDAHSFLSIPWRPNGRQRCATGPRRWPLLWWAQRLWFCRR